MRIKQMNILEKQLLNFEKSYEISPDKATKQQLFKLFTRLGETDKAAKYK